jgi:hypothetical protein
MYVQEKHSPRRVQYYLQFQPSVEQLGRYPPAQGQGVLLFKPRMLLLHEVQSHVKRNTASLNHTGRGRRIKQPDKHCSGQGNVFISCHLNIIKVKCHTGTVGGLS